VKWLWSLALSVISTNIAEIIRTQILNLGSVILSKCYLNSGFGSELSYLEVPGKTSGSNA